MATVRDLVRAAVRAAEEKKATDVKAIDIRGLSSVTDYMVIATGSSDTNVRAIAEAVRDKLLEQGERPFSVEGLQEGSWALLDYVDFVVHVFHYEKRLYFGLEELWADARPVPVAGAPARKAAPRTGGRPAAKPAAAAAEKRSRPPAPRTVLKPTGKKTAVPKRGAAKPAAPAKKAGTTKKTAAPKGSAAAKKAAATKTTAARRASAVPKPKKAVVPKRKAKG